MSNITALDWLAEQREILDCQIYEYDSDIRLKQNALIGMRRRLDWLSDKFYALSAETETQKETK